MIDDNLKTLSTVNKKTLDFPDFQSCNKLDCHIDFFKYWGGINQSII